MAPSVPASWGWAAAGPAAATLGSAPLGMLAAAVPLAADEVGAGLGFPFMFPGLGRGPQRRAQAPSRALL
jgi:hypothetical protein